MKCPRCGGGTKVLDTRQIVLGSVPVNTRRRECVKCGERVDTTERPDEIGVVAQQMKEMQAELSDVQRELRKSRAWIAAIKNVVKGSEDDSERVPEA